MRRMRTRMLRSDEHEHDEDDHDVDDDDNGGDLEGAMESENRLARRHGHL